VIAGAGTWTLLIAGFAGAAIGYNPGMDGKQVNGEIGLLVERWCQRRDLHALAGILPAWLGNNGLTDGWAELAAALRTMSGSRHLPQEERDELKRLYVVVDYAVRNR
jgi:hypothetical protein